jgi:hypothetical protein
VILTSAEAAAVLGVNGPAFRKLVHRGLLTPIMLGTSPLTFHAKPVYDLQVQRRTKAQVAWHEDLWAEFDREYERVVAGHG